MKRKIALASIIVVGTALLVVGIFAGPSENATYVGSPKCKKCHIKLYKSWQATAHAKNFEVLKMMGREADAECVGCHTTGYGKEGGFVDLATTPKLVGAGCESCHGPGSEHLAGSLKDKEQKRATINKLPEGACLNCHKSHEKHDKLGKAVLPVLKKKLEELQKKVAELEGK